jgi:CBS domain-containing protein
MAMKKLANKMGAGVGATLLCPAALAAQAGVFETIFRMSIYGVILFVGVVFVGVFIMRSRDKRRAPLSRIFEEREAIHSVGPDTPVIECVRTMASERIGALMVIDGEKLVGIFTERDALNKVMATGLDPARTKVSDVMTMDPCRVAPTTTVGDAMELLTQRRLRYLPIVENGKVLAVASSGDLTHWLVKDQTEEVQELVDLAAQT